MNRWSAAPLVMAAVATLSACSFSASVGATSVSKDDVQKQISEKVTEQGGTKPASVTCPADLKGDKGQTLRCQLTDSGETYGVTVTVTSVKGGDVKFDFKVDDQPQ